MWMAKGVVAIATMAGLWVLIFQAVDWAIG
jgi:hypothetical protein